MNTEARNDIHRIGAIQPESYRFVGWYYMNDARKGSSVNKLDAKLEAWKVSEEAQDFKALVYGDFGRCGCCGQRFVYGEVWQHDETKDMLHIGNICAAKYRLLSGTDWTAIEDMRSRARKAEQTRIKNEKIRAQILADNPELVTAFETDHYIVRDIKRRFESSNPFLSAGQIALVFKIAKEEAARKARPVEATISAPIGVGRKTIRGVVVSKKTYDSMFGETLKMTVKVQGEGGVWLAWGTVPQSLMASMESETVQVGDTVEFDASLVAGREPHFAIFQRPTRASIVARRPASVAA